MATHARRGRLLVVTLTLAFAVLALAGAAGATDGALPGGTSISVDITAPPDGTTLNEPNVPVTGTAAVGAGPARPEHRAHLLH